MCKWREIHSLHSLIFSLFPSISYIKNCLILSQNVKYCTFVANVTKDLTYALWGNNLGSNSLWESSASCDGLSWGISITSFARYSCLKKGFFSLIKGEKTPPTPTWVKKGHFSTNNMGHFFNVKLSQKHAIDLEEISNSDMLVHRLNSHKISSSSSWDWLRGTDLHIDHRANTYWFKDWLL